MALTADETSGVDTMNTAVQTALAANTYVKIRAFCTAIDAALADPTGANIRVAQNQSANIRAAISILAAADVATADAAAKVTLAS